MESVGKEGNGQLDMSSPIKYLFAMGTSIPAGIVVMETSTASTTTLISTLLVHQSESCDDDQSQLGLTSDGDDGGDLYKNTTTYSELEGSLIHYT